MIFGSACQERLRKLKLLVEYDPRIILKDGMLNGTRRTEPY